MPFPFDGEHYLIEMLLVPGPRTPAPELIRILLPELAAPLADGLIRHRDAAFAEEFFYIPKTQTEAEVEPNSVADDFDRKAVILIASG